MVLIKNYIESFSYDENLPRDERIKRGRPRFFDFDYPFYDESKREEFEIRLIKHFYMRESVETIGLTKWRLEDYLNLNMPYWNKMFESELKDFPVFEDFEMTIKQTEKGNKNSQTDTDSVRDETRTQDKTVDETENKAKEVDTTVDENNFHRNTFLDTPESDLQIASNGDGTGVINRATTLEEDKNVNKSVGKDKQKDVNSKNQKTDNAFVENETKGINTDKKEQQDKDKDIVQRGKKGVTDYADLLKKYRSTFMRIEKMIFSEINKEGIFLLVYGGR